MAQQGTDLNSLRTQGRNEKKQPFDIVPVYKFPQKKYVVLRLFPQVFTYGAFRVRTKGKDGSNKTFMAYARSYDPASQTLDSTIYDPWRDLYEAEKDLPKDERMIQGFTVQAYMNAIHRATQKQAPRKPPKPTSKERKSGFKEKDSDSFTSVVPIKLPSSATGKLREQGALNTRTKNGETNAYPLTHPKYGCDVRIMHDGDKSPADQYSVVMGERVAITEDEDAYLKWDLSDLVEHDSEEEAKRNFDSWAKRNGVKTMATKSKKRKQEEIDNEDDDEEEEESSSKKSKKSKSSKSSKNKKSKSRDDDDEDDEDLDDDIDDEDDEEDEDEPKSKKSKGKKDSKKSKAKSKKSRDEDDEDEDDEDEDSDDEDEDDDLDDDEDEDDEEDDEPKKGKKAKVKAKSKAKGKKSKSDDDDEDEDDDSDEDEEDEDDEDEDEPKSKKGKKSSKPAKSKKSKSDDDEDDEEEDDDDLDDEDEDEDEDEDDEPPKKSKSKVKSKSKGKKKK